MMLMMLQRGEEGGAALAGEASRRQHCRLRTLVVSQGLGHDVLHQLMDTGVACHFPWVFGCIKRTKRNTRITDQTLVCKHGQFQQLDVRSRRPDPAQFYSELECALDVTNRCMTHAVNCNLLSGQPTRAAG